MNKGWLISRAGCALMLVLTGCGNYGGNWPATQPVQLAAAAEPAAASRTFVFTYSATIAEPPTGARRLDLWLPLPSSDAQQTISNVHVDSALRYEIEREREYGNRVVHVWSEKPSACAATVRLTCTRREERSLGTVESNVSRDPAPSSRLVQSDRLGVIDDGIRGLARQITTDKPDTLAKARAIYDYVIDHMSYDKSTPGWGNGDTARACNVHKGNCTDFHALFIALARAAGIPARFGIGFQVPKGSSGGKLEGYHCWAEFWLAGAGWIAVDASEAWKHPERRDYYFGSLDADRVRVSLGRDVQLPGMHGEPLNYFLSPRAEIDGRAVAVAKSVQYSTSVR